MPEFCPGNPHLLNGVIGEGVIPSGVPVGPPAARGETPPWAGDGNDPPTEAMQSRLESEADLSLGEEMPPDQTPPEAAAEGEQQSTKGLLERTAGWIGRNKVVSAAGAITVGSLVLSPVGETLQTLKEVAPYVGTGVVAAEAAWIGGAAMMLAALGVGKGNIFKIRSRFSEIVRQPPSEGVGSALFTAGFAVNTTAAITQFVIPAVAVTTKMPPETWGVLSFSTLDLWATYIFRRIIWRWKHQTPTA